MYPLYKSSKAFIYHTIFKIGIQGKDIAISMQVEHGTDFKILLIRSVV